MTNTPSAAAMPSADAATLATALEREALLARIAAAAEAGEPLQAACRREGISLGTHRRWAAALSRGGFAALAPQRAGRCGRQSAIEKLQADLGPELFRETCDKVKGINFDMQSPGLAWRVYARRVDCPAAVRDYFEAEKASKHNIARSLLDAVRVAPEEANRHRGARRYSLRGMWTPRELDVVPGDVFSSDDVTPIWCWWVPWPEGPQTPHGRKLLQGQFLPVVDVASQNILSYGLVARELSSYRAADIWALWGHVFDTYGLPRLGLQMERGSWEAKLIEGETVEDVQDTAYGQVTRSQRVGGLRMLPTTILPWHRKRLESIGQEPSLLPRTLQTFTSYLPKSKSIEALFNRLQKFEGTLWGALGRDQQRCPFEKTKRVYEACKRGAEDPGEHFLSADEIMDRLDRLCREYQAERIEGAVFNGRPDETWSNGLREHGPLKRLPDNLRYLYQRDWSVVKIARGLAHAQRKDPATGKTQHFYYANADLFARSDVDGRRALVYFDALNPAAGAEIVSLSGQWLGRAEFVERQGMFFGTSDQGHRLRREMAGAVLAYYSDVASEIPSLQVPDEVAERRELAKTEDRRLKTEDLGEKTEDRRLKTEDREAVHTVTFDDGRRDRLAVRTTGGGGRQFARDMVAGTVQAPVAPLGGRDRKDDLRRRMAAAEKEEEALRLAGALW